MYWQILFRSYDRFFAEFLGEKSLVRLGLLDLTTCVGLRYGSFIFMLREFSWKALHKNFPIRRKEFSLSPKFPSTIFSKILIFKKWCWVYPGFT